MNTDRAALNKRAQAVTAGELALKKAEANVAKRERKVGLVEKEIRANTISGEGIYQVGKDMKPGSYRTTGSDGANCYYDVLGDANGNDIKSNNNTTGPAIVAVNAGHYFQTSGCDDWVLSR